MNYIRQKTTEVLYQTFKTKYCNNIFHLKNGRKKSYYYDVPIAFDIETTNIVESEKAYMYIWQFGYILNNTQYVVKGRTWQEFDDFIKGLSSLIHSKRLIIWVANLPFEFMFLWGRYKKDITDIFCKEKYKPLKFVLFGNLEFRDAVALTNSGLAKIGEDYCTTQKLVGDLDYKIMRNTLTPLTEEEECYCDNDVIVLCEFAQYVFKNLIIYNQIPLTQTSILRLEVKNRAYKEYAEFCGDLSSGKRALQNDMVEWFPSERLYKLMMNFCFKGGYNHAQFKICEQILYEVDSYDETSEYPSIMLQDIYYFPKKFLWWNCKSYAELLEVSKTYCTMSIIEFEEIEAKTNHSYISIHKCMHIENCINDNGRVRYAKKIQVMETELDLKIYELFYKWKGKPKVIKSYKADRIVLPDYLKIPILENYVAKARLKKEGKPYANEKAKVNSGYGLTVQRMIEEEIYIDENYNFSIKEADSYEKQVKKSVLLPQWGIYICAWGRYNLATSIIACNPNNIYYNDTDSLKGHFDEKALEYIKQFNQVRIDANKRLAEKYNLDIKYFEDLGCFDYEGKYERFKTLGSKRYIYEQNGEFHQTIAGLGKNAMIKKFKTVDECFNRFENKMIVEESDKLRSVRNFEPHSEYINGVLMSEESSIALVPVEFTLKMKDLFLMLIHGEYEKNKYLEKRLI